MKTRIPSLALLLATFASVSAGCDINIGGPDDGVASSDTDGADDDADTDGMMPEGDGSSGSGPSLPTAGDEPDEPAADGSSGGFEPSSACEAYCQVELACDEFFDTNAECVESCEADRLDSGECAPALDGVNACLASLDCDGFFDFWLGLSMLDSGEDPGEFPCLQPFYDYAVCLDPGGGVGGA